MNLTCFILTLITPSDIPAQSLSSPDTPGTPFLQAREVASNTPTWLFKYLSIIGDATEGY